jgi:hypothetical protein
MKVGSEMLTLSAHMGYQPDRARLQSTTTESATGIPLDLRRGERVPKKDLRMTQQTFCQVHWRYEDTTDAYRICGECFHVFPTAQALLDDNNKEMEESHTRSIRANDIPKDSKFEPIRDVEQIHSCPHCCHDW